MSPTLDIQVDERQMLEISLTLKGIPRGMRMVLSRAINKVGVAARTAIVRRVLKEVRLKTRQAKQSITLKRATYRHANPTAHIRVSGYRVPLLDWGARQLKGGVSYAIRRGGRKKIKGAFIATMPGGHRGVFVKTGAARISRGLAKRTSKRKGRKKGMAYMERPRLPITERYGPSLAVQVENIAELGRRVFDEKVASNLAGEVNRQVGLVLERHRR